MRLLLPSLLSGIARQVFYFCFSSFCVVHSPKPGKKAVHSIKICQNDMQIAKTLILVRAQQWRRLFGGKQAFLLPTNSIKRKVEKSLNFYVVCLAHSIFHASLSRRLHGLVIKERKTELKRFRARQIVLHSDAAPDYVDLSFRCGSKQVAT